ncbi:MAG TPA: efflux RND transporter periplasmic adaptor subunit, partial [Thermodesulfovibrionia bacterium]|nr:efflux RND transporter periplasmic adaptor subunit [Thermodesulfovibrionia bacterium]
MKKHVIRTVVLWIVLIAFAFGIGYLSRGNRGSVVQKESHVHEELSSPDVLYWTCSMHPQIRMSKPGKCPICGMDLIPVKPSGGQTKEDSGPRELVMSERARKLAGIRVEPVIRKAAAHEIQLFGKVVYDETRIGYITSRFPGRLDKLYVDYTGTFIKKNQPMAEIYSPELLTAQQELIHALQTVAALKNSKVEIIKRSAEATVEAARQKLRLLDLTDEQIRKLETKETFDEHITIYAPLSGVVIKKEALEGMYVDTGTTFYTVADLANVWVFLDAYESDIQWLKLNQNVTFEAEAFPGRAFHGPITFIDPVVDQKTRTIKIRIQVDNSDYSLKPDMFVRAS